MTQTAVHLSRRRRWACCAVIAVAVGVVAAVVSWPAGASASAQEPGVSVIGQVPALFTGQLTVTNDFVDTGGGDSSEIDTTTTYSLQMQLQGTSSPGGTFYQWNVVPASSTWHTTYNSTDTDTTGGETCTTTGVAEAGGNFVNAPDLTLMQQFDGEQGPDIETSTGLFDVPFTDTCQPGSNETSEQAGFSCQHQDDTPVLGTVDNPGTSESVTWDYSGTTNVAGNETETCSMKGTLTASCASTAAAARTGASAEAARLVDAAKSGPRLSAADAGTCITITSPPKDAKIALTDPKYIEPYHSHPPADNERAPATKSLLVQGTVSCGCPVTVNGVAATVSGQQWTVTLPDVKPGSLTITAQGSGGTATQANTLVDLRVTNPAKNAVIPVTAQPAMPDIAATAEAAGLGASPGSLKWTLKAYGEYITSKDGPWVAQSDVIATGTTSGSDPWHPSYSVSAGGYARVQVEANLPGVLDNPVTSDPQWFQIPGTNPGKAAVIDYLKANAPATYNVQSHLLCVESGYRQFDGSAGLHEPSMAGTLIPKDFEDPAPGRPVYGPPSGFGVSQLDPSTKWPAYFWNWRDNEQGGIDLYGHKVSESKSSVTATMKAQQKQLEAVLRQAKAGAGVSETAPLPGGDPVAKTPDLTDDQQVIDVIRRYNGGKQYKFDGKYVLGADHHSVHFIGSGQWILNSASWGQPSYVSDVEHCAAAGAPLNLKDDAKATASTKDTTIVVVTPAGQHSVVTDGGFTAGIAVHLTLEPSGKSLGVTHANKRGEIKATVTVPTTTKPGSYVIRATDGNAKQARSIPLFVVPAPPAVAKVSPAKGKTAGGTIVTVTGSRFTHVSQVLFGSTPGTKVHVISSSKLTVVAPGHAAGLVAVRVITKSGSTTLESPLRSTDHFTYTT